MSGPTGTRNSETCTLDSRKRLKPQSVTLWEEAVTEMPTEHLVDLMFVIRRELHQRELVRHRPHTFTGG